MPIWFPRVLIKCQGLESERERGYISHLLMSKPECLEPPKGNYRQSELTRALRDLTQLPHLLDENNKDLRGDRCPQSHKSIKVYEVSRLRSGLPDETVALDLALPRSTV